MSESATPDIPAELSPAGRDRRDAMLGVLVCEMQTLHRRRRARRQLVSSSLLVMMVVGLSMLIHSVRRINTEAPTPARLADQSPHTSPRSIVEFVQTDESLVERFRADSPPRIQWLDDQTLLAALDEFGRPTGLIRAEGRAWLTGKVVDPISPVEGL